MKISCVIVSYNSRLSIAACLDSVFRQLSCDKEVVLVDNGSTDGTKDFVGENYTQVKIISNLCNKGASFARNQGIAATSGDWVLTLDADTVIDDNVISNFSKWLGQKKENSRLGSVSFKILYNDAKTIYSLGHNLTFLRRFYDIGMGRKIRARYEKIEHIFGACSAAALYKREMLVGTKVGSQYFDDNFFFIAEDVDLAWRARKIGWKAEFCNDCVAYHSGNNSKTPEKKRYFYNIRNRFLMIFKNDTIVYLIILSLPLAFYEAVRFVFFCLTGRGWVYITAALSTIKILSKKWGL